MNQPQIAPSFTALGTTDTVETILAIVEAKVPGYCQHAVRVRSLVELMLAFFPVTSAYDTETILDAALLHDIGKAQVPAELLDRPGPLTIAEMAIVRSHAEQGADLLETRSGFADRAALVRHHHEWWDGRGYPFGLAGDAVPFGSRLIGIADSFDAMTSDRPYRTALSVSAALAELERFRGSQFDPQLVDLVLPLLLTDPR